MRVFTVFLCVALLLPLSGCFDYNELNMQELVNGASADVTDDGVRVVVTCASDSDEEDGAVYTYDGASFFDAVRGIAAIADKKLYWGHARTLVLGEAACGEAERFFDAFLRAQDVYLDIAPVAARGNAEDIIKGKTASGADVTESISGAFANEKNSRRFRMRRMWELLRDRERKGVFILPTAYIENGAVTLSGGTVIGDGGVQGYLSGEQMLFLSLMTEEGAGGYLPTTELPGGRLVSFEVLANKLSRREKDGHIHITQKCVLAPAEVRGMVNTEEMRLYAEKLLSDNFNALIRTVEENSLGDIFDTGGRALSVKSEVMISNILGGK